MLVRLVVKLADELDGIDVSDVSEGDLVELPDDEAGLLIAENWAEAVPVERFFRAGATRQPERAIAADGPSSTPEPVEQNLS